MITQCLSVSKAANELGLSLLLELNGEVFFMDSGYWVKFSARKVTPTEHVPHGIKYSLTLHDHRNKRIVGYDNAHEVRQRNKGFTGQRITWDHKHHKERVQRYEFESPGKLMQDFWKDVDDFTK